MSFPPNWPNWVHMIYEVISCLSYLGFAFPNNYLSSRYKARANAQECFHGFCCALFIKLKHSASQTVLPRLPGIEWFSFTFKKNYSITIPVTRDIPIMNVKRQNKPGFSISFENSENPQRRGLFCVQCSMYV